MHAFLNRSKKCGFCPLELQTFSDTVNESDQHLFHKICNNPYLLLYELLPPLSVASHKTMN